MSEIYNEGSRKLQDRFDTRRLADRVEERMVHDRFTETDRAFIERLDMFFLATADADGQPSCSYKGGDPGFVRVIDDTSLVFPNYDGNGMFLSMGNVLANRHVGMLFIDFEAQRRMRIQGEASLSDDPAILAHYPEAQFIVRVTARQIFPNCPRYIHKLALVERSRFVPHVEQETPVPDWKRSDWARDALPANDPARMSGA